MRIDIVSKNYKVSDHIKEIIEKKTEKFSRYFDGDAVAKYNLKQIGKEKFAMEITMFYNGNIVRSEVISDNMYNNIDVALPKLEGQIRKLRTKIDKQKKDVDEGIYEIALPQDKELVRTKTFSLQKISVKEAIYEMELVDHDFFAFVNEANGMVNVVYRRSDGNVGMLDLIY